VGAERPIPVKVEGIRFHGGAAILKLAGYDDPESAGRLRGEWLLVPEEQAIPLEEGEYFLFQAIGLQVLESKELTWAG
jgi:16S rRNA processing protein RimM